MEALWENSRRVPNGLGIRFSSSGSAFRRKFEVSCSTESRRVCVQLSHAAKRIIFIYMK